MGRKRTSNKMRTSISVDKDDWETIKKEVERLETNNSVFFTRAALEYIRNLKEKEDTKE